MLFLGCSFGFPSSTSSPGSSPTHLSLTGNEVVCPPTVIGFDINFVKVAQPSFFVGTLSIFEFHRL